MSKEEKILQSQVREDKIHDRFVIVAPGRAKRPKITKEAKAEDGKIVIQEKVPEKCVFCREEQKGVKSLYYGGDEKNWKVKVVKNIFPAVTPENDKAYGYQEVVIETAEHGRELGELPLDQFIEIMQAYIQRLIGTEHGEFLDLANRNI